MIAIVDYGVGNLGSVLNMLKKIGAAAVISSQAKDIEAADKIILPGVGAFDNATKNLSDLGLIPVLNKRVMQDKVPILGICLGLELFTQRSQEGKSAGLGWLDAETVKFNFAKQEPLKVPHMGWNRVVVLRKNILFDNMEQDARFYFVHSYHVVCRDTNDALAKTNYGYDFTSAVVKENIAGVQFHPEKSHKFGIQLFKNFVELF